MNAEKHGLAFEEAATAFGDPLSLTIPDPDHSDEEDRFILMGETLEGTLVVVMHTDRGNPNHQRAPADRSRAPSV